MTPERRAEILRAGVGPRRLKHRGLRQVPQSCAKIVK